MNVRRPSLPAAPLGAALVLLLVWTPALHAQNTEEMAFGRQVFEWFLSGQADPLWERAAAPLREMMQSPAALREVPAELGEMLGAEEAVLDEQLLMHEGARVYLRTARYQNAPELFWAVTFTPEDRMVQGIVSLPRQAVARLYPDARLP